MPLVNNTLMDRLQPRQDRRAIALERRVSSIQPSAPGGLTTTADPYSANAAIKIATAQDPHIVMGRIAEILEYGRSYRVKLERGGGLIVCCELNSTSLTVMGAKQLNSYLPETMVVVLWHPHSFYGIIVGAVPDWMIASRDALSDYITQGSDVGLAVDQVCNYPLQLNDNGGVVDWSAGRPFDHIATGDWGAVTDTGAMVFLDPYMTFMRVDEETGMFFFYDNQRGRLTAHNLQIRSAQHEYESYEDQGESDEWEGHTTGAYCERMGSFAEGNRSREITTDDYQLLEPWYSRFEPESDDQQAIFRLRVFRGYLGQGDSRMLCIPPEGASGIQTYSEQLKFPGVAEDQWSTDGMVSIRSAKALIIAKRAILPNPKQLKLPEDVNGDIVNCVDDNYRFRGKLYCTGNPPEHKVGDIVDAASHPSLVRAAAFRDLYALKEMHKDLLGLRYHKADWYVPNESDYDFSSDLADGIMDYSLLCSQQWLDPPDPIHMTVDDRYNDGNPVSYYPTDSHLALLEDGAVSLADGYGAEFRMIGGSMLFSCPGDIWMLPGRSFNCWAGWDITERANNCVDIVANNCDVRIKAQNNCYIMGGNATCGGVLIESKSPSIGFRCLDDSEQVGGIILRAKHSAVVTYGAQIEMILSGQGNNPSGKPPAIIMQAHDGLILSESKHFFRFLHKSAQDAFVDTNCGVCGVNEFWCNSTLFDQDVRINGGLYVDKCTLTAGGITSGGNVVAPQFLIINDYSTLTTAHTQLVARVSALDTWAVAACQDTKRLETDSDVTKLEFYFRSTAQQKLTNFALFESKWQQEARIRGDTVKVWTENPVVGEDCFSGKPDFSYPPPGKTAWVDDSDLYTENVTLFDLEKNLMEDWGDAYEYPNPKYDEPETKPFDGNFMIVRETCVSC